MNTVPSDILARNSDWLGKLSDAEREQMRVAAQDQRPRMLMFACVDSRVLPAEALGIDVGEALLHRNIANQFHPNDPSAAATLEFAVDVLGIDHIVVCGHSSCGGIKAALAEPPTGGSVGHWVTRLKHFGGDVHPQEAGEADADYFDRIARLAVAKQLRRLGQAQVVQRAWSGTKPLVLHGWFYNIETGQLQELHTVSNASEMV